MYIFIFFHFWPCFIAILMIFAYMQNSETISRAQIRERAAVLVSHGAVTIAFLSCRKLDSIPAIYVGANSARACISSGMIYYAGIQQYTSPHILTNMLMLFLSKNLTHLEKSTRNFSLSSIKSPFSAFP